MYMLLLSLSVFTVTSSEASNSIFPYREAKYISRLTSTSNLGSVQYPLCDYKELQAACLHRATCNAERGTFLGYCGGVDGTCCQVVKNCNSFSASHHVIFRNPSFPANQTDFDHVCPLVVKVGRNVCALRLNNEVFESSPSASKMCPQHAFYILGIKGNQSMTPVCGNLTGWQTTFEVEEFSEVQLVFVGQKSNSFRFSIHITMIECEDVVTFRSPTYSGVINQDAKPYKPTPKPKPSTTTTTEPPTTTDMEEESGTPTIPPLRSDDEGEEHTGPTTLKRGKLVYRTTTPSIEIRAPDNTEGDGVFLDSMDPVPKISAFRQVWENLVENRCWQRQNQDTVFPDNQIERPSLPPSQCWHYDILLGRYVLDENCKITPDADIFNIEPGWRVIGGRYTDINKYPWQAALIYKTKFFCGGALINNRYVLTAGHCIFAGFSEGIHLIKVSLGDHDIFTKKEAMNRVYGVSKVIWHPYYTPVTTINDIALLELNETVEFSKHISAVRLPTDLTNTYENANVTVTGWGRSQVRSKKTSNVLKELTSTVHDIDKCINAWSRYPKIGARKHMHICINIKFGTPCHGDSGGPLVTCSSTQCTLVGVVSFGFPFCTNVGLPAVFTRVTSYKRWIDINTTPLVYNDV